MKTITQAMDPKEAAQAFYGQDQDAFTQMVEVLSSADPRLLAVFQRTRQRYLESRQS